jgi:hypothetical protein
MCSNIPASPAYGVYISQLIGYARASSNYSDFLKRQQEAVVVITQYIRPIEMELTYTVTWTQMLDTGQFVFYNSSILLSFLSFLIDFMYNLALLLSKQIYYSLLFVFINWILTAYACTFSGEAGILLRIFMILKLKSSRLS